MWIVGREKLQDDHELWKRAEQRVKARREAYMQLINAALTLIFLWAVPRVFAAQLESHWLLLLILRLSEISSFFWAIFAAIKVIWVHYQQRTELRTHREIAREKAHTSNPPSLDYERLIISDDGELIELDDLQEEKPKRGQL
jgi:hypothetical protein